MWHGLVVHACAFTVSILGGQGRLGRELALQSLERGWDVEVLARRPADPVCRPDRVGWLTSWLQNDEPLPVTVKDSRTCVAHGDAVVITTSGAPFSFEEDATWATRRVCAALQPTQAVCLVSAYGVGDEESNLGIEVMRNFYLKGVYDTKRAQEEIVSALTDNPVKILRPKVLSIGRIPNKEATTRRELAGQILDWCAGCRDTRE